MADALSEAPPTVTDTQIEAAHTANIKYGDARVDNKSLLSGPFGTSILDTEESLINVTKTNEKLLDRSMVDQVTGLPNEKAFEDMMQGLEGRWDRDHIWGTFVVADLTGLHDANNLYGRSAGGDDYLKAVGSSLGEASRGSDRCFRMGTSADEFVLYLPDITDKNVVDTVIDRVDLALQAAQEGYQTKYSGIKFGLSYSASSFGEDVSPRTAIDRAMNALGDAKKSKDGKRVGTIGRIFVK